MWCGSPHLATGYEHRSDTLTESCPWKLSALTAICAWTGWRSEPVGVNTVRAQDRSYYGVQNAARVCPGGGQHSKKNLLQRPISLEIPINQDRVTFAR